MFLWMSFRPDVLKNCLQRSVEKGYLEQITGKGASGTFQVSPKFAAMRNERYAIVFVFFLSLIALRWVRSVMTPQ